MRYQHGALFHRFLPLSGQLSHSLNNVHWAVLREHRWSMWRCRVGRGGLAAGAALMLFRGPPRPWLFQLSLMPLTVSWASSLRSAPSDLCALRSGFSDLFFVQLRASEGKLAHVTRAQIVVLTLLNIGVLRNEIAETIEHV